MKETLLITKSMSTNYGEVLLDIKTPIVVIFGSGDQTNTDKIQINLVRRFIKKGYFVSSISVVRDSIIPNAHVFPFELFQNREDYRQILAFNHYVHELCKGEKPDLLIIEAPYGILPINNLIHNDFGSLAFKISSALNIDLGILSLYCSGYTREFFEKMELLFQYRFSIDNVFFNLHDKSLDWAGLLNRSQIKLMDASPEDLKIVKKSSKKDNVYILSECEELSKLADVIEAELTEYSTVDPI